MSSRRRQDTVQQRLTTIRDSRRFWVVGSQRGVKMGTFLRTFSSAMHPCPSVHFVNGTFHWMNICIIQSRDVFFTQEWTHILVGSGSRFSVPTERKATLKAMGRNYVNEARKKQTKKAAGRVEISAPRKSAKTTSRAVADSHITERRPQVCSHARNQRLLKKQRGLY